MSAAPRNPEAAPGSTSESTAEPMPETGFDSTSASTSESTSETAYVGAHVARRGVDGGYGASDASDAGDARGAQQVITVIQGSATLAQADDAASGEAPSTASSPASPDDSAHPGDAPLSVIDPRDDRRARYMDYLNVLACFAVVMLHCTLEVYAPSDDFVWSYALAFQCCSIFAVPMFLMLSGAHLLGYRERYSTKVFFKKRLKRILIPLLAGNAAFYLAGSFLPAEIFPVVPRFEDPSLVDFLLRFLTNDVNDTLWFFYTVLMLYLLTPLLSKIVGDKSLMRYALAIGLVVAFALPCLYLFFPDVETYLSHFTALPMFSADLVYFLLGYYLARHFDRKVNGFVLIALSVVVTVVSYNVTQLFNTPRGSDFDAGLCTAWSATTLVLAVCLFLFFKNREGFFRRRKRFSLAIARMAQASIWVYVFHLMFIYCVAPLFDGPLLVHSVVQALCTFAVMMLLITSLQALWRLCKRGRR